MNKNIIIIILALCALGLFAMRVANMKYDAFGKLLYSKKDCVSDLNQIADIIKNSHPAPYDHINESDFDKLHQSQIAKLKDQNTISEFHWIARKLVASIGCGHTSLSGKLKEREVSDSIRFPLDVKFIGERLFLIRDSDKNNSLISGTEILQINNQSVIDVLRSIMQRISSDGHNKSRSQYSINREAEFYLENHFHYPEFYTFKIVTGTSTKSVKIKCGTTNWVDPAIAYNTSKKLNLSLEKENDLAILTLKSFNYYRSDYSIFSSFLDSSMLRITENKINNLIIDIRGNGGGNPYCANHLLKYISSEPFQYFHKENMGYPDLKKEITPFEKAFTGNTYMIIDGGCGSTSGHLASLVKYNQPATLVGQVSGASYKCHDNSSTISLNKTGLNLHVARNTFKTAVKEMSAKKGIIPDILIENSLDTWIHQTDNVMDSLYHIIRH